MKTDKRTLITIILSLIIWLPSLGQNSEILEKLKEIAIIDQKVMMPMRDGVRLATDIYRPKTDEKVPIIFSKTPRSRLLLLSRISA